MDVLIEITKCEYHPPSFFQRLVKGRLNCPEEWSVSFSTNDEGSVDCLTQLLPYYEDVVISGRIDSRDIRLNFKFTSDSFHPFTLEGRTLDGSITAKMTNTNHTDHYTVNGHIRVRISCFYYNRELVLDESYPDALSHIYRYLDDRNNLRCVCRAFHRADTSRHYWLSLNRDGKSFNVRLVVLEDGTLEGSYPSIDNKVCRVTGNRTRDELLLIFTIDEETVYCSSFDIEHGVYVKGEYYSGYITPICRYIKDTCSFTLHLTSSSNRFVMYCSVSQYGIITGAVIMNNNVLKCSGSTDNDSSVIIVDDRFCVVITHERSALVINKSGNKVRYSASINRRGVKHWSTGYKGIVGSVCG